MESVHEVLSLIYKKKIFTKVKDVVNIFNIHFSTIGRNLGRIFSQSTKITLPLLTVPTKFKLQQVTLEFVRGQLLSLKPNKAIGLDKINARLLKDATDAITPVLAKIIMSIDQRVFPDNGKSAKVTALFKTGDRADCNNYRPISVLPTVSKILEWAIHFQLYDFLKENNLLYLKQFGFQHRRSTSSALLQFTDDLLKTMDNRRVTEVIYLDLQKAFDTADHGYPT